MKPICYNMYKWGVQMDVGGATTEKSRGDSLLGTKGGAIVQKILKVYQLYYWRISASSTFIIQCSILIIR